MKMSFLLLLLFLVGLSAPLEVLAAEATLPTVALKGIARFASHTVALLELTNTKPFNYTQELALEEGWRDGDIEVSKIDVAGGRVKIKCREELRELSFPSDSSKINEVMSPNGETTESPKPDAYIRLANASRNMVFEIYQQLLNRTLLAPSSLPNFEVNLISPEPVRTEDVVAAIERAFQRNGVWTRKPRDKFVVASWDNASAELPEELWSVAKQVQRPFPQASSPPKSDQDVERQSMTTEIEIVEAGMINFRGIDFRQCLAFFGELANRTLIHGTVPGNPVFLKTFTPMSRTEAIYAMMAVLYLDGYQVFPVGDRMLLMLPRTEAREAAAMIAQKPSASMPLKAEMLPKAGVDLRDMSLTQFARFYGDFVGLPVEFEPRLPQPTFSLTSQTELSAAEVLRAMDLLLACHHLAAVPTGEGKGLKLVVRPPRRE